MIEITLSNGCRLPVDQQIDVRALRRIVGVVLPVISSSGPLCHALEPLDHRITWPGSSGPITDIHRHGRPAGRERLDPHGCAEAESGGASWAAPSGVPVLGIRRPV